MGWNSYSDSILHNVRGFPLWDYSKFERKSSREIPEPTSEFLLVLLIFPKVENISVWVILKRQLEFDCWALSYLKEDFWWWEILRISIMEIPEI